MKETLEGELRIWEQESGYCASDVEVGDVSVAGWLEYLFGTEHGYNYRQGDKLGKFRITVERIE